MIDSSIEAGAAPASTVARSATSRARYRAAWATEYERIVPRAFARPRMGPSSSPTPPDLTARSAAPTGWPTSEMATHSTSLPSWSRPDAMSRSTATSRRLNAGRRVPTAPSTCAASQPPGMPGWTPRTASGAEPARVARSMRTITIERRSSGLASSSLRTGSSSLIPYRPLRGRGQRLPPVAQTLRSRAAAFRHLHAVDRHQSATARRRAEAHRDLEDRASAGTRRASGGAPPRSGAG